MHDGHLVVLAPGRTPGGRASARRGRPPAGAEVATVGVAAAAGAASGRPPTSRRGAAPTRCCTLGRSGEVSDPAGLGLARLLLGTSGPEELGDFVDAVLGPVLAWDAARDRRWSTTLEAWFAAGGSLRGTGERLHVHPNTVAQRLDRVGRLLGDGLARPGPGTRRTARAAGPPAAQDES